MRTFGTIDGKHVASPTRAPDLNPARNEGGTVAERDPARQNAGDFIRGVVIEPQFAEGAGSPGVGTGLTRAGKPQVNSPPEAWP